MAFSIDFMDRLESLPNEYIHDIIFPKLLNTCVKYRNVLPEMEAIENAIASADHSNYLQLAAIIIDTLKTNAERSRIIQEISHNVQKDFQHGIDSRYPKHEGKYYINSIISEGQK